MRRTRRGVIRIGDPADGSDALADRSEHGFLISAARIVGWMLLVASTHVSAAAYPDHAIRLIVPFTPGGGNDTVARLVSRGLAAELGQAVVVDNRAGAGGIVGAEAAARAPADGYTLFLGGVGSHAINPNLHAHLPYDPIKDFAPISLIASAPLVLVVHPGVPAHSVQELIALAKAEPGRLNYASNGNGSSSHLAAAMFASLTGIDIVHVPYKGSGRRSPISWAARCRSCSAASWRSCRM